KADNRFQLGLDPWTFSDRLHVIFNCETQSMLPAWQGEGQISNFHEGQRLAPGEPVTGRANQKMLLGRERLSAQYVTPQCVIVNDSQIEFSPEQPLDNEPGPSVD